MVYGQEYIPEPRTGNIAVQVDSELKIYFIGGDNFNKLQSEQDPENEFFYLNIDTTSEDFLSLADLKIQGIGFPHTFSPIADIGGVNNDSIFIIGGAHLVDESNTDYFYKFDIKTNELSIPVIQGKAPPIRIGMKSVSFEGKIYMFGGRTFTSDESLSIFVDQFNILDTIDLNWQVGNIDNSPVTLSEYTATLVDGTIYYIGGRSHQHVFSPMTKIFQYNIVKDKWSLKRATIKGITPGPRIGHSAVLYDGKIYIYGGSGNTTHDVPARETFIILDTATLIWSIPPLNGTNVPKLAYHTASLKESLMIIAFGKFTDLPNTTDQNNNSTYYFYLNNSIISWDLLPLSGTTSTKTLPSSSVSVVPKSSSTPTETGTGTPSSLQNPVSRTEIAGISFGLVSVILIMSVVNLFIYKRMHSGSSHGV